MSLKIVFNHNLVAQQPFSVSKFVAPGLKHSLLFESLIGAGGSIGHFCHELLEKHFVHRIMPRQLLQQKATSKMKLHWKHSDLALKRSTCSKEVMISFNFTIITFVSFDSSGGALPTIFIADPRSFSTDSLASVAMSSTAFVMPSSNLLGSFSFFAGRLGALVAFWDSSKYQERLCPKP